MVASFVNTCNRIGEWEKVKTERYMKVESVFVQYLLQERAVRLAFVLVTMSIVLCSRMCQKHYIS